MKGVSRRIKIIRVPNFGVGLRPDLAYNRQIKHNSQTSQRNKINSLTQNVEMPDKPGQDLKGPILIQIKKQIISDIRRVLKVQFGHTRDKQSVFR
jgi:hypothetical protein